MCMGMTSVFALSREPTIINENTFLAPSGTDEEGNPTENRIYETATLYVPASSLEAYKTTAPWNKFGTIVGLTKEQIDGIKMIENEELKIESSYYDLNGRRLDRRHKGINIIRYSDGTVKKVLVK